MKATPFLKWAGGKRRLLDQIMALAPSHFTNYYEPFLGGGALFFHVAESNPAALCHLSDTNADLINAWQMVRSAPVAVFEAIESFGLSAEDYYAVRALKPTSCIERAAQFIYLNKLCFNGLYRVNKSGRFNVPYGDNAEQVTIATRAALEAASATLWPSTIEAKSFELVTPAAGSFIYCDPPYIPLKADSFTAYTNEDMNHAALRDKALEWAAAGAKVVLSNSSAPAARELYSVPGFKIHEITATRNINRDGAGRSPIAELLIETV